MLWLKENPFSGSFQSPLFPERDNDLDRLYASVDGFKQATTDIDKWSIAAGRPRTKPFVALIFGPKGSGRSSTARYIAYRCAAAIKGNAPAEANQDLLKQCFVEVVVADEHPVEPTENLVRGFFDLAGEQGIKMGETVDGHMLNNSAKWTAGSLSNLYTKMRIETKAPIRVPIFCLEQIRNFEQISGAVQAFRTDAILICTTTIKAVMDDFLKGGRAAMFSPLQFNLTGLAPTDVADLYQQRWRHFAKDPEGLLPIEKTTIEKTFKYNWPIKGVVIVLDDLLSAYADTWANAPLELRRPMDKEEMLERIVQLLATRREDIIG